MPFEGKSVLSEVDVFQPAMNMKYGAWSALFFVVSWPLLAGRLPAAENPLLDENQVHQAMRAEAFRLLAQKIDSVRSEAPGGFDYHIEQAYEKIKKRLPSDPLSAGELEAWLRQFLQNQKAGAAENEFLTLIENFIKGMSLEIINTLQYECEQTEDLIARVQKLESEIKKTPRPDQAALARALPRSGLGKKTQKIIKSNGRRWATPPAGADNFSAFSIWKKNMTGQSADQDLRLVFDLGDRYQSRYPFLDEFMENYRCLAETFRRAVHNLNALPAAGNDPDSGSPD